MSDPELEKIRQQRLAQLQAQHGVSFVCYWGYVDTILIAACYFVSVDVIVNMLLREYPKQFIIWCRSFNISIKQSIAVF